MCEHYVARADEPFRLDELWPFTERLERYRDRRLRLGRGVARARWPDRFVPRHARVPGRPGAREGRGGRDDRGARPPPPAVEALDARDRRYPAVRRPGRPLLVQPQRRLPRGRDRGGLASGPPGRIHGRADTEVGARWLEDAWDGRTAPVDLLATLHETFGGQANLSLLAADGAASAYAGNTENPVFTFRLGRIGLASHGHLLARSELFRFVAPGATDRRLVRVGGSVTLNRHGVAVRRVVACVTTGGSRGRRDR